MKSYKIARLLKGAIRIGFGLVGLQVSRVSKVRPSGGDRYIIKDRVAAYLRQTHQKFVVLDGGARDAFSGKHWKGFNSDELTLYGFEVSAEECYRLNEVATDLGLDFHFYPFGLWGKKGKAKFYYTEEPSASSFYIANEQLVNRWLYDDRRLLRDIHAVKNVAEVDVTTIESWQKENDALEIDFIKLNVQGSELEILKGAGSSLDSVVGLQLEMQFRQAYLGAPQFCDIDKFLRETDFTFFDFLAPNFVGSVDSPVRVSIPSALVGFRWPSRQLLEGHFLYFRDPIAIAARGGNIKLFSPIKLLKLASFAEMWGQIEYAFEVLSWLISNLREKGEENNAKEIAQILEESVSEYSVVYRDIKGFINSYKRRLEAQKVEKL